jgi:hypothetical protein
MLDESTAGHYLDDAITTFRAYKKLAEKALDQLRDEEYFTTLDEESNSIAVVMKHLAGNMLSRWTDLLTTDGEKPERDRDMEFNKYFAQNPAKAEHRFEAAARFNDDARKDN